MHCGSCGRVLGGPAGRPVCPHCGQPQIMDDTAAGRVPLPAQVAAREGELDAVVIARVAQHRRALIRLRSYYLIGLLACGVLVLQVGYLLGRRLVEGRLGLGILAEGVLAGGLILLGLRFRSRLGGNREELGRLQQLGPTSEPDYSKLSDGSQLDDRFRRLGGGRS